MKLSQYSLIRKDGQKGMSSHDGLHRGAATPLIGREREEVIVNGLLSRAADGESGVLVVQGDPGIGKTALLDRAAGAAVNSTVIRVLGVESERELPFAGLHRALMPVWRRAVRIPDPQRAALESAFGLVSGPPPVPMMIGLGALSLLAQVAADAPLLCIIDDAQWVDQPSLEALGFVGRRLLAEGIVVLFGARTSPTVPAGLEGLPQLELGGLDSLSVHRLLASRALRPETVDRLIEETGGNPLALLELAGEPEPPPGAPGAPYPALTPRLLARFAGQVQALPEDAQRFLLLAAAEPACDLETLLRAAARLGVGVEAAGPGQAAGLIAITERATFRHPLIRAAVYASALEPERRRAHDALAHAFGAERDRDRRAWHRAVAAVAPDDGAADELERSAMQARGRAGYAVESASLERAAALTSDEGRRAERLLGAAAAAVSGTDAQRALALLEEAGPLINTPLLRAQARRMRALTMVGPVAGSTPVAELASAAQELEPLDVRLSHDTWLLALGMATMGQESMVGTTLEAVGRGALAAPPADSPTISDRVRDAFARRVVDGPVRAASEMRAVVALLAERPLPLAASPQLPQFGYLAAHELADYSGWAAVARRAEAAERRRRSPWFSSMMSSLAIHAWLHGEPDMADAYYAEAAERPIWRHAENLSFGASVEWWGWQGAETETLALADAWLDMSELYGMAIQRHMVHHALTLLELGHGRYEAALTHARALFDIDPFPFGTRILPELVEAAVRSGDRLLAVAAQARLSERSLASGTPAALSFRARGAALVAEGDEAEGFYREALAHLEGTGLMTAVARTRLLYGEWLRRQRRRQDAREQLRTAHEQFASMRGRAFAERARIELLATGEHARVRTVDTKDLLTPQEAQIARLAARRATNGEIAAQLFISESTVAYHLRKVFRKLDVTSRRDLRSALAPPVVQSTAADEQRATPADPLPTPARQGPVPK